MSRNSGSSYEVQQCVRCDTNESVLVRLQCHHPFCLVCLSYLYVKGRAHSGGNGDQVLCSQCDRTTRLDIESVEAIKATIEGTLLPSLNMLDGNTLREEHRQTTMGSKRHVPSEKNIRLDAQKVLKKLSDGTTLEDQEPVHSARNFFVDSPKESMVSLSPQEFCKVHSFEEVSFVCLTCQQYSLCQKCIQSRHRQHQIQSFGQAIESVTEWLNIKKHENDERIEFCQLRERRVGERKLMMHSKWEKVREQITDSFEQLRIKLKKRQTELTEHCDEHYRMLEQSLERELERISRNLQSLKIHKGEFRRLSTHELFTSQKKLKTARTIEFFGLYHTLKDKLGSQPIKIHLHENHEPCFLSLSEAEVASVAEAVASIGLGQPIGMGTMHTQPQTLRVLVPDKYTSLNSSRERTKRVLKTQQDSSGMLSKRNTEQLLQTYERMSSKKGFEKSNMPSSISRFFDKQTVYGQKMRVYDSESIYSSAARSKMASTKLLSKTNEGSTQPKSKKQLNLTKERIDYRTVTEQTLASPQYGPAASTYETKRKRVG